MGIRPGKAYVLAAAGVLALTLAGCGGGGGAGSADGPRKLTLIQGIANEPFYISMYCGAKARAAELGAQLDVQAANEWDVAQQTQIVNAVAAKRPDAVMVAPVDKNAMAGPIRQLQNAGSKVIMVDTDLTDQSIGESRISSDNRLGGRLAAQALAEQIGGKGKVMLLSPEKGIATTDDRVAGFHEEIKKHPDIQVVSEQYPGDDEGKATSSVTSELSAHQDLAAIFATNLVTGNGAATALKQTGKVGDVKLIEFDASPKQVADLKAGTIQALITQEPLEIGRQGVTQAMNALTGKPVTKSIKTKLLAVTKDNMNDPNISKYLYREGC